jgi:F0F1-type ATP synthase assembly protein I
MPDQKPTPVLNVWAIAGEVGFLIAIPLVVLVLLGIKLDKYFATTPLFIIVGMLLAFVISTISIARKVKQIKV